MSSVVAIVIGVAVTIAVSIMETTHKPELDARTREILKSLPPGLIGATPLEDAESPLEEP